MNGQSAINHPTNPTEQLIGKFHVVNIDKLPTNSINNSHDETANIPTGQQQTVPPVPASSSTADESACASRFQMIRVDRNFGRGRWKVNDYEPPENLSNSTNPPVNTIENESTSMPNSTASSSIPPASTTAANTTLATNAPTNLSNDSNTPSSAALAATVATAAAATVTAFQQQQQRLAMVPPPNVPPPAGFHPYPTAALANMTAPNQSYLLPNHHQFGYYPYFPPHYSPYAAQWATLAASHPYLPPPMPPSQLPTGNLGDPLRLADTGADIAGDNSAMSSNPFPNPTADHLQNAQLATAASFIYAPHHPHSAYVPQPPPTTASPYSTIGSYHPAPPLPTIIPPPTQPLSLPQIIPSNNTTDLSYQGPPPQQQAPILTSPKHEAPSTRNSNQQSNAPKPTATTVAPAVLSTAPVKLPTNTITNSFNTDTLRTTNATQITDLLSSSPSLPNSQQPPASLLSPIAVQAMNPNKTATSSLNDIWSYGTTNSPLNLSHTTAQTAAATAVAAMGLLNNESSQGAEIASEILKELTTPTKQNISTFCLPERRARLRHRRQRSTTDIDNKISAAMDLVKAHLLSAVREEVTELRQQIRTLNEKVNSVEHENAFLRQHVPSEIYAQYVPLPVNLVAVNDGTNSSTSATTTMTTTTANTVPSSSSSVTSSQPIPMTSLSSLPLAAVQQIPSSSTTSQSISALPLSSLTNFPPT